jgi:hypothetical protein
LLVENKGELQMKIAHTQFRSENLEEKDRYMEIYTCRWEGDTTMDLREIRCDLDLYN